MARPRVRERLLDAAHGLLCDEGVAALTTRGVASRAGTTEASVFNNFGDKAGLLRALVGERLPERLVVEQCIEQDNGAEMELWLCQVYLSAEAFYAEVVPLMAALWTGGVRDASGQVHEMSLFPLYCKLQHRLKTFQCEGRVAQAADIAVASNLLLGAALHSALQRVSRDEATETEGNGEEAVAPLAPSSSAEDIAGSLYTLIRP